MRDTTGGDTHDALSSNASDDRSGGDLELIGSRAHATREAKVDRLPLSCVRTFAVVGRLLSISRAAEELNVTPSAVSHQIKLLETHLDTRLFRREKNKLRLTQPGEQYMAQVSEALLLLTLATERLKKGSRDRHVVRIGCTPSFALLWLVARLQRFRKLQPELDLTVTAVPDPPAVQHGAFDVAFWYGSGAINGFVVEPLSANRIFPICKRSLAEGERGLRAPGDLARCTLIECSDETYYRYAQQREAWGMWLEAARAGDVVPKHELNFTPRVLMHKAVCAGLGVGLTRTLLAADGLASREFAVPFGPAVTTTATYNLVVAPHVAKRKDIAAFREWVLDEASASAQKVERMLKRVMTHTQ